MESSVRDEWASESLKVAIARASSWNEIATQSMHDHRELAGQLASAETSDFLRLRQSIRLRHYLHVMTSARAEIRDALDRLPGFKTPPDIQFQRDALDLAGVELDDYLAKAKACDPKSD